MLVDTHAHLNFPDFQKDLNQVIKRSIKAGVSKIICVSSNLADSQRAIKIAQKYSDTVSAAVGIHPQKTDPDNHDSLATQAEQLAKLAQEKEVVAIGECGLDYSPAPPGEKDRSQKEQLYLFQSQIKIAQGKKLPLLIHTRKAFSDTVGILKKYHHLKGVFHCYSAGKKGISQVNELGFLFGVDGNLTYDEGMQNVFKLIPLEKIILETDAPFLSPEPCRGQRNEPKNIRLIAECLAQVKGESFEKVAKTTTQNVNKLFKF